MFVRACVRGVVVACVSLSLCISVGGRVGCCAFSLPALCDSVDQADASRTQMDVFLFVLQIDHLLNYIRHLILDFVIARGVGSLPRFRIPVQFDSGLRPFTMYYSIISLPVLGNGCLLVVLLPYCVVPKKPSTVVISFSRAWSKGTLAQGEQGRTPDLVPDAWSDLLGMGSYRVRLISGYCGIVCLRTVRFSIRR